MSKLSEHEIETKWTKRAQNVLFGRTIVKCHYMSKENCEDWGWYKRPIVFELDNGTVVVAQCDDEGNDGGVLWYTDKSKEDVMPVL